jgi:hypothetical protein
MKPIVRALALVAVVTSLACSEKAPEAPGAAEAPAAANVPAAALVPGTADTAAADTAPADIAPANADAVANALEKELDAELAEEG